MLKVIIPRIMLMLFSPIMVLFRDLRRSDINTKKWSLIIFITFYGSVIQFAPHADGIRHLEAVYRIYLSMSFNEFLEDLYAILTFNPQDYLRGDVYIHILSYLTGGILHFPPLLYVLAAFVYGYFFSGTIFKIIYRIPSIKYGYLLKGFIIVFILWKNIEGVQSIRTWTGLWVLVYASISYYQSKKIKYLFLMATPPLIHFGYLIMSIPAFIVLIFGNRSKIYSFVFILSFFFSVSQQVFLNPIKSTELGSKRSDLYYDENYDIRDPSELYLNHAFYVRLRVLGVQNYARDMLIFTLIFSGIYIKRMKDLEKRIFSIGILTVALSNIVVFIPELSVRTSFIGGLFILLSFVIFLYSMLFNEGKFIFPNWILFVFHIILLLYIPYIIYSFAVIINYVSGFVLFIPFLPWIYPELNFSIREFLGFIIGR